MSINSSPSPAPSAPARRTRLPAVAVGAALLSLGLVACSSSASDDEPSGPPDSTVDTILEEGSVVPPVSVGVGGGAPTENLDPAVEPGADDVNGDGQPG